MKLTDNGKTWLAALRNDPKFLQVTKELKALRPVIPQFHPQASQEANNELLEQIKFISGKQVGFDLIYSFLTGEKFDN